MARNVNVDALEIVLTGTADADGFVHASCRPTEALARHGTRAGLAHGRCRPTCAGCDE
jgi:hypothetical protein